MLTSCHVNRQGLNRSTVLSEAVLLVWKYIFTLKQARLFLYLEDSSKLYTFVSLSRVINRDGFAFRPHAYSFPRKRSYIKAQIIAHLQSIDRLHMMPRRPY